MEKRWGGGGWAREQGKNEPGRIQHEPEVALPTTRMGVLERSQAGVISISGQVKEKGSSSGQGGHGEATTLASPVFSEVAVI
jgi:hypothetical protein